MHLILSDGIDSGKSTFLFELARELIERGASVSGWTTPAHMEGDEKVGHDIVFLRDGELEEPLPFTRLEPFEGSFPWRRYHFNASAFEYAKTLLPLCKGESEGVDHDLPPLSPPYKGGEFCGLFVMDEIGPLELEEGEGFIEAFEAAISRAANTLVVVRSGSLDGLSARLGEGGAEIFSLDESAVLAEKARTLAL